MCVRVSVCARVRVCVYVRVCVRVCVCVSGRAFVYRSCNIMDDVYLYQLYFAVFGVCWYRLLYAKIFAKNVTRMGALNV